MPTGKYIRSEKYKRKVSEFMQKRKHTLETREKMSRSGKGKHSEGHPQSEESKLKISLSKIGDYFRLDPRNVAKFEAAKRWCQDHNMEFKVIGYEETGEILEEVEEE